MRSKRSVPGVCLSMVIQRLGRLWGCCVVRHARLYLDRRCAQFPLTVSGREHLHAALERPCLIVANHVLIQAVNAPLGRWTQMRALSILNQPPDSFILRRIIREETGLFLYVVAKSDRGWWSPRPFVKLLQKRVGQPFGKGMFEGIKYVPIEHNPDCFHRSFFQAAAEPIGRGLSLLIFPGKLRYDGNDWQDSLVDCDLPEDCILPGAAHLARKFSLPIIPVFIQGGDTWRPDKPTCVTIGPAFDTQGMTKNAINHAIVENMRNLTVTHAMV